MDTETGRASGELDVPPVRPVSPAAEWPTADVVTAALADPSWRPRPFLLYVLKLHGRCNLACDYCYVYEMADQSWRSKPAVIARSTVDSFAARLGEHARRHGLDDVHVVFHGGEPLLAGADLIDYAATIIRREAASTNIRLSIQTNGVLLDQRVLPTLLAHDVRIGVSLDGGQDAQDRHRRHANGRGSHAQVLRGLAELRQPRYARLYAGLLCTIDVANDPVEVYESLLALEPPGIDLLLPHGTWEAPPPDRSGDPRETPYADWLIAVFDRWYGAPSRETSVRLFESVMSLVLGGVSRSEVVGLEPFRAVMVDTDGSLELADQLKAAFDGAPVTGLNVRDDPFDTALAHPGVVARQRGRDALCRSCRDCPVHRICGGGQYPHRYRSGAGFLNPSVYCPDLYRLVGHIRTRVLTDLRTLGSDDDEHQP